MIIAKQVIQMRLPKTVVRGSAQESASIARGDVHVR